MPDEQKLAPLDIEERKLRIEEGKLENERSFARRWFPTIATLTIGLATLFFNGGQVLVAYQERLKADADAKVQQAEAKERQNAQWGINVLELYFKYPAQFDPKLAPETAPQSLMALASVAPQVMRPILENRRDQLVRKAAMEEGAANAPTIDPDRADQLRALQSAIEVTLTEAKKPPNTQKSQANWPQGINPADFTVYIQYGNGAKDRAGKVADWLRENGFKVPGLEAVAKAPNSPQIRYYRTSQIPLANAIVEHAGHIAGATIEAKFIGAGRNLPDGILEIWLPGSTSEP